MSKPTWIFVAGTYRTASTTQYRIVRDIVEETGGGLGIGYHTEKKLVEFDNDSSGDHVVCKVFIYLPETSSHGARFLAENRIKSVVTIRDPRDIITSMRERHRRLMEDPRHQAQPFDFDHRVTVEFPEWLENLQKWIDNGAFVSRYEDFTTNILREVNRLSEFLDIPLPNGLARKISFRYTCRAIALHKKKCREEGEREDPWLPSIPATLFGRAGEHVNKLSNRERKLVEKHNQEFMRRWEYL